MKHALTALALVMSFALAHEAVAQSRGAKTGAYETLSDANRRIVSAIYESQLGSRRDLEGHPLLSKDQLVAMRRQASWEEMFGRLAAQGYVAFKTLTEALSSYGQEVGSPGHPLIIITGAGEQVVVQRRAAPRRTPVSDPALANIIPSQPTERPPITVTELPTANGADAQAVDPAIGGLGVATSSAQAH